MLPTRPQPHTRPHRKPARLHLEQLEDRCLLSLTPGPLVLLSSPDPLANCPGLPLTIGGAIFPTSANIEPYVTVNPTNPKNIAASWIDHGFFGNVASISFNGGNTWENVAIPGITQIVSIVGNAWSLIRKSRPADGR